MLGSPDSGVPVLQTRNARVRRVVMPLLIAVVVAVLVLLLARSGQQSQLIGSGSTLAVIDSRDVPATEKGAILASVDRGIKTLVGSPTGAGG